MQYFKHGQEFTWQWWALGAVNEIPNFGNEPFGLIVRNLFTKHRINCLHPTFTRMLAQHNAMITTDQLRIKPLIVVRMLQQAFNVDTGFAGKNSLADQTFLP